MIISNQRIIGLVMMNGFSRSFQLNCNDLNTKDVNKSLQIYMCLCYFLFSFEVWRVGVDEDNDVEFG